MQLHELKRIHKNKTKKRVGRGGKRGKTSGKGHKGQKARAGGSPRPEMRDIIKKIPKLRGHGKNRARTVNPDKIRPMVINLSSLNSNFSDKDTITPKILIEKGIVQMKKTKMLPIKILGNGDFSKKGCTFEGFEISKTAKEKLEKVGSIIK